MIKIKNISKTFQTGALKTNALNDLSLDIKVGEFIAIVGPSGSGKSTFLNILGLLDSVSAGSYEIDGVNTTTFVDNKKAEFRNQKIGFIFQSYNLLPDLTVAENVAMPLFYQSVSSAQTKQRVEKCLELVGLKGRTDSFPAQLSGGQQQRIAIARSLVTNPRFILADEPTGNLDSNTADSIMELLHQLNAMGTTVVMVTHNEAQAQQASRVIRIVDGQIYSSSLKSQRC